MPNMNLPDKSRLPWLPDHDSPEAPTGTKLVVGRIAAGVSIASPVVALILTANGCSQIGCAALAGFFIALYSCVGLSLFGMFFGFIARRWLEPGNSLASAGIWMNVSVLMLGFGLWFVLFQ